MTLRAALGSCRRPAALVALVLVAGCGPPHHDRAASGVARVDHVSDGDTIVLVGGQRVRLVQIDAPEFSQGECFARTSADALKRLLPDGSQVTLQGDPPLDDVDRFGRLLRYVFRNGRNVNLTLVRQGAAAPYFFDGDRGRYADDLLASARRARRAHRGLWGACPGTQLDPERGVDTGP